MRFLVDNFRREIANLYFRRCKMCGKLIVWNFGHLFRLHFYLFLYSFVLHCIFPVIGWIGVTSAQSGPRRPPNYSQGNMPVTSFSCRDKILGGYYADPETDCQMFHVCVKVPGQGVSSNCSTRNKSGVSHVLLLSLPRWFISWEIHKPKPFKTILFQQNKNFFVCVSF